MSASIRSVVRPSLSWLRRGNDWSDRSLTGMSSVVPCAARPEVVSSSLPPTSKGILVEWSSWSDARCWSTSRPLAPVDDVMPTSADVTDTAGNQYQPEMPASCQNVTKLRDRTHGAARCSLKCSRPARRGEATTLVCYRPHGTAMPASIDRRSSASLTDSAPATFATPCDATDDHVESLGIQSMSCVQHSNELLDGCMCNVTSRHRLIL